MRNIFLICRGLTLLLCLLHGSTVFAALTADELLLVVNRNSPEGVKLAAHYAKARGVPVDQIITLDCSASETVDFDTYERHIAAPVRRFLLEKKLDDKIKCLVTFYGVPLRTAPRALSEADKAEAADLKLQHQQLLKTLAEATAKIEAIARQISPGFNPASTGQGHNELRQRLAAGAGVVNSALPGVTDPAVRAQIENDAKSLDAILSSSIPGSITTRPSTAPSDVNPSALAADAQKLAELTNTHFDAESRSLLRSAVRTRGLLAYSELIDNQIEYLNAENNVPSLFSALAILAAAALLFTTATAARRSDRPNFAAWCILGAVFTWLGIDESVGLHEMLNRPVRDALQVGGPLYFAWVIPYAVLLGVLVALLWRFVFGLDALTRRRFIVAGVVYVTGALLLEMIGARIWLAQGAQSRLYYIETTAEESLEMLGIALFIRAIIAHHGREFDRAA